MSQQEGGAPNDEITWRFADPIPGTRHFMICKFCDKRVTGGITD